MTTRHTRQPAALGPRLTDSWDGGVIGWIVVFGASIAEIIVGTVTNRMPMVIAAPALALPVAVVAGFALVQWLQARATAAAAASWWHEVARQSEYRLVVQGTSQASPRRWPSRGWRVSFDHTGDVTVGYLPG